jgi:hypothetical protein
MLKPQFGCFFSHHFVLKVTAIINDNLTRDTESGANLIEYEEGDSLPVGLKCRHGFDPLSKVVYGHNNVLIPLI